eukprot:Tamp_30023.p1 GENE.Tamp_30023~~Tamp_30023.p1  ORF type:complete len:143 (-),score=24.98 Tamp_30023:320-748(-)
MSTAHARPRAKLLGWGGGHQRPAAGVRVRMIRGLMDRGVGTVLKVVAVVKNGAHPACRVRWDDGSVEDYYSGMTFSRAACARSAHPHFDTSALEQWVEDMGWGSHGAKMLASHSVDALLQMGPDELNALIRLVCVFCAQKTW